MNTVNTAGLMPMQARVLIYISAKISETGLSPSYEEIRDFLGHRSKSGAHRVVCALRERGRIVWQKGCPRSIQLAPAIVAGVAPLLPPDLQARLDRFCAVHDEQPANVMADALSLHFDALGPELAP